MPRSKRIRPKKVPDRSCRVSAALGYTPWDCPCVDCTEYCHSQNLPLKHNDCECYDCDPKRWNHIVFARTVWVPNTSNTVTFTGATPWKFTASTGQVINVGGWSDGSLKSSRTNWKVVGRKKKKAKKGCPVCDHMGITFSSALDGRAQMTCGSCSHQWTESRKKGRGYKWARNLHGEK